MFFLFFFFFNAFACDGKMRTKNNSKRRAAALSLRPYPRVPPVLLKADPRLTADRFDAVKTDPTFLYRTLSMCEDCAVQHNAVAVDDLSNELPPSLMRAVSATGRNGGGKRGGDQRESMRSKFFPSHPLYFCRLFAQSVPGTQTVRKAACNAPCIRRVCVSMYSWR